MIVWNRCRCGGEMRGMRRRLPNGRLSYLLVCDVCGLAMEPGARRRERLWDMAMAALVVAALVMLWRFSVLY